MCGLQEQPFSYAIGSPDVPKTRYIYDPSEIRAFTWSSIMEMAVSDKKRFSAMKAVSEYGMSLGDDPFQVVGDIRGGRPRKM